MKKLVYLFCLFTALFASCSKNDDFLDEIVNNPFVGVYSRIDYSVSHFNPFYQERYYEINADGAFWYREFYNDESGVYSEEWPGQWIMLDNNIIYFHYENPRWEDEYGYFDEVDLTIKINDVIYYKTIYSK